MVKSCVIGRRIPAQGRADAASEISLVADSLGPGDDFADAISDGGLHAPLRYSGMINWGGGGGRALPTAVVHQLRALAHLTRRRSGFTDSRPFHQDPIQQLCHFLFADPAIDRRPMNAT